MSPKWRTRSHVRACMRLLIYLNMAPHCDWWSFFLCLLWFFFFLFWRLCRCNTLSISPRGRQVFSYNTPGKESLTGGITLAKIRHNLSRREMLHKIKGLTLRQVPLTYGVSFIHFFVILSPVCSSFMHFYQPSLCFCLSEEWNIL